METFYHGTQKLFNRFDLSHAKESLFVFSSCRY